METLAAISRWLAKQHVVTWCVANRGELWCANAFYIYDPQKVAFYLLSEDHTRHSHLFAAYNLPGRYGVLRRRKAPVRVRSTTDAFLLPVSYRRRCGKFASPN